MYPFEATEQVTGVTMGSIGGDFTFLDASVSNAYDTGNHNASSRRWLGLEWLLSIFGLHRMGSDVWSTDAIVVIGGGRGCLSIYDIECCHYVSLRPIRTSTLHDTVMLPSAAIQVITNNTSDKLLRVRPPHPSLRRVTALLIWFVTLYELGEEIQ
ncbi:hypothetical protein M8C21_012994 [Ambrosia artemisiifolia]|uniref:Uncharacterized protein n=1 Tax=Ambrosia artemisiifolia TaxID=4212 RepID=A0AAD5CXI8_AMBAR|nr:hypothetical protein M8C21_012994 [Ambrosia artemisiifolia]